MRYFFSPTFTMAQWKRNAHDLLVKETIVLDGPPFFRIIGGRGLGLGRVIDPEWFSYVLFSPLFDAHGCLEFPISRFYILHVHTCLWFSTAMLVDHRSFAQNCLKALNMCFSYNFYVALEARTHLKLIDGADSHLRNRITINGKLPSVVCIIMARFPSPNFRVVRNSSKSCSLALENINLFGKEKLKRKLERKLCYGRGWWWLVPLASLFFFPFLLEANMLSVRDWFGFSHVHPCVALVWPSYRIPYFVVVMGERSLMPNLIEASAVTNSLLKPRRNSENVTVGMYDIRLLNEWHPVNSRVWSLID